MTDEDRYKNLEDGSFHLDESMLLSQLKDIQDKYDQS